MPAAAIIPAIAGAVGTVGAAVAPAVLPGLAIAGAAGAFGQPSAGGGVLVPVNTGYGYSGNPQTVTVRALETPTSVVLDRLPESERLPYAGRQQLIDADYARLQLQLQNREQDRATAQAEAMNEETRAGGNLKNAGALIILAIGLALAAVFLKRQKLV